MAVVMDNTTGYGDTIHEKIPQSKDINFKLNVFTEAKESKKTKKMRRL